MGTAGALLAIASIILFAQSASSLLWVAVFFLAAAFAIALTCRIALQQIAQGQGGGVYLDSDQEGFRAPSFNASFVGKEGVSVSPLNPSGFIKVEGKRLQAVAKSGFVESGQTVQVIGGEGAHLTVIEKK